MITKVIKIDPANPDPAAIVQAAAAIDRGELVSIPTETVYGIACRATNDSIQKLTSLKSRTPDKFYSLHIADKSIIHNYIPKINLQTKKLIENLWPGPLTIVFQLTNDQLNHQKQTLTPETFNILYKNKTIGIRCPDNPTASAIISRTKNAVFAPSANITGQPPAVNAQQVQQYFNSQIEMIIDGGECKFKQSSTVIKSCKGCVEILREGVVSADTIRNNSRVTVLIVCTGNTCRSPMAEGIFKKQLAEKMSINIDKTADFGYKILSAGTMGICGVPVTGEAVNACRKKGYDIATHHSRALSEELINSSDLIFAMTGSHKRQIVEICPEVAEKCFLLDRGSDIPDPIGQGQDVYNFCADAIEKAVNTRICEFLI